MSDGQKRLTRRDLIVAGTAGAGMVLTGQRARTQAQGTAPPATAPEELVFVNGRIHTMDATNAVVNTVTVRNGRFTGVGGQPPRPAPGRRIIDLRGRTAIPGIIDNHNHIVLMGNRPGYHTPLESASSIGSARHARLSRARTALMLRSRFATRVGL